MDPWVMFCFLSKLVVETERVYLDVMITSRGIEMQLMPCDDCPPDMHDFLDDFFNNGE